MALPQSLRKYAAVLQLPAAAASAAQYMPPIPPMPPMPPPPPPMSPPPPFSCGQEGYVSEMRLRP